LSLLSYKSAVNGSNAAGHDQNGPGEEKSAGGREDKEAKALLDLADQAVAKGLCELGDLPPLVEKYRGQSTVFKRLSRMMQHRESPFASDNGVLQILHESHPKLTALCLSLTETIEDEAVFDAAWKFIAANQDRINPLKRQEVVELVEVSTLVAERYGEEAGGRSFDPRRLDEMSVILSRSEEPGYDLHLLSLVKPGREVSLEDLHRCYGEGPYIVDPRLLGEDIYSAEELELRMAFGRMSCYPSIEVQNRMIPLLINLPEIKREALELVEECQGDQTKLEGCEALLSAMGADVHNVRDYLPIIDELRSFDSKDFQRACNTLQEIMSYQVCHVSELLPMFQSRDFPELEEFLYRIQLRAERQRNPEKDLEEIRCAFLTKEHQDSEPPPEEALDRAFDLYQEILKKSNQYLDLDHEQITERLRELYQWYESEVKDSGSAELQEKYRIEFFALARNLFERRFGIYPYNTQMITLLLLTDEKMLSKERARGLYAQIKTGEGKSLVFALLAAYLSSQGHPVHIITSNNYLAGRDALKFKNFYGDLGRTCASFEHHHEQPDADIIYTTSTDLIWEYLGCRMDDELFFAGKPLAVALVDESDNLCIDETRTTPKIGHRTKGIFSASILRSMIRCGDNDCRLIRRDLREAVREFQLRYPETKSIDPVYIAVYLQSADSSYYRKENEDFVIRRFEHLYGSYLRVCPVDVSNTGRVRSSTEWSDGKHEMVSLRHNIDPGQPLLSAAQMSHPTFLKLYQRLICITGTMGDKIDRSMTRKHYKLIGFDVPSHHQCLREDHPPELELKKDDWLKRIGEEVRQAVKEGRPVLLITQSIGESEMLSKHLQDLGIDCQQLNDNTNRDKSGESKQEEELIKAAGQAGMVTVATSVAGRGADIIPEQKAIEAGGLLTVVTFVPVNSRVEFQARGRAGRQGKPGISKIIACAEIDRFIRYLPQTDRKALLDIASRFEGNSTELQQTLDFLRRVSNVKDATVRERGMYKDKILFEALEHYFLAANRLRDDWPQSKYQEEVELDQQLKSFKEYWVRKYDYFRTIVQYKDTIFGRDTNRIDYTQDPRSMDLLAHSLKRALGVSLEELQSLPAGDFRTAFQPIVESARRLLIDVESDTDTRKKQMYRRMLRKLKRKDLDEYVTDALGIVPVPEPVAVATGAKPGSEAWKTSPQPEGEDREDLVNLSQYLHNLQLRMMQELRDVTAVGRASWTINNLQDMIDSELKVSASLCDTLRQAICNYALGRFPNAHHEVAEELVKVIAEHAEAAAVA